MVVERFLRSNAFRWAFLVAVALVGSAAAYLGLRKVEQVYVEEANREFLDHWPFVQADAGQGWVNRPGTWIYRWDYLAESIDQEYRISDEGLRVSGFYDERPLAEPRAHLWVLGDSSAFGLGEEGPDSFAERLKVALHERGIYVRNFAVIGYHSGQILELFRDRLGNASAIPNTVVFWGGFNDVEFTRDLFWATPVAEALAFQRFTDNVSEIIRICRDHDIRLILNTLPSRPISEKLGEISAWLRTQEDPEHGIHVNDVRKRFESINRPVLYSKLDYALPLRFHPSAYGHRMIAAMLVEALGDEP